MSFARRLCWLAVLGSVFPWRASGAATAGIEAAAPLGTSPEFFDHALKHPAELPRFTFRKSEDAAPPASAPTDVVIGGSKVSLLIDPPALVAASLKMIQEAKTSIDVEMYKLSNERLIDALLSRAADPGIQIRLVLDPFRKDAKKRRKTLQRLRQAGIAISFYPTDQLRGAIVPIDHVKLLIVDRDRALTGGSNWNKDADIPLRRDYNLRLEGAVVRNLSEVFEESWALANGLPVPLRSAPSMDPGPEIQVLITDRDDQEPLEAILAQIKAAKKSIRTEQFLFNEKRIVLALIEAHDRGVDVRVLMDPNTPFFGGVNIKTGKRLLREGLPIRFFKDPTGAQTRLHAKVAVFDDETVIIGSANWSRNALHVHHELALLFRDPTIGRALNAEFDKDWDGRSSEIPSYRGLRGLLQFLARLIAGQIS